MTASSETGLLVEGLRCAGCVGRVERALRALPGVESAVINYTNHRALVRFDAAGLSADALVQHIEELGFGATPYDPETLDRPAERGGREALVRLLVAGFLAMNVMWLAIALYIGSYQGMEPDVRRALRWLTIGLSLPAATWCALPFWQGALAGLRRGSLSIDVPIVLGVSTAFAVSVAGTLADAPHLFVDSAAMIVFLILLGRTLEYGARARASNAVERLVALAPRTARRRGPDGLETVSAAALEVGDRVVVPAGETFPVDGRLIDRDAEVDESPFTGESRPVLRRAGESVIGGARNLLAEVEIAVLAPLAEGSLARLVALLERAQSERPRIQQLADRIASWFAPVVLSLAALTGAIWWMSGASALEIALIASAVLIVACPCALGLATPVAVSASIGRAAALGILVKSGEALERCAAVDTVLLDKTGTLTQGRFELEGAATVAGVSETDLLCAALAAEGESTHPVAEGIRRAAGGVAAPQPQGPRRTIPGAGVIVGTGDAALRAGSLAWLEEQGVVVPEGLQRAAVPLAEGGTSLVWVSRGQRALGVLALSDPPRFDARETVERLRDQGLSVALVTGDRADAAQHAAERSLIDDVVYGASPDDKVRIVRERRARGARVLVAGDGINDAAALAAGDVGVAMARGSDVSIQAAHVVIGSPRLAALDDLVALSRACVARIRENLGLALVYNLVAVPLAVAGILEPLHAAIAMSASSVAVCANAARLLRFRSSGR